MNEMLSIVVPCFNEEQSINIFYETVNQILATTRLSVLDAEYLFVDDGSQDCTLEKIKELAKKDKRVRYVSFSRNFGKEAALLAGLRNAGGDYVVTMDVDLQDPPDILEEMYEAVFEEGFDCAAARRSDRRGEGKLRSFFSNSFYFVMNKLADVHIIPGARDYRFMKRIMVDAVLSVPEYNRFSKGIFSWVGFRTKWISYENVERKQGNSKWSVAHLFSYAAEGIIAYSTKLLLFASALGLFFCGVSFLMLLFLLVRAMLFGDPVAGWPSMMCAITLLGGLQLLCIGILGMYLSKTYLETKKRPIYIEKESNITKEKGDGSVEAEKE